MNPELYGRRREKRRRVAARIAYQGAGFRGFQRQPAQRTVEGSLLEALVLGGYGEGLGFASRTDAGVHARAQVIAFKVPEAHSLSEVESRLNAHLPPDIRLSAPLVWAPPKFHPRWSACGKRYEYRLPRSGVDLEALEPVLEALRQAPRLDGFTAAGAPPKEAPPLTRLSLEHDAESPLLVFEGLAFRRYAIRHMVGAALGEARGELPAGSCRSIAAAPPPYRGLRAEADGLTLVEVFYPPPLDPFR